MEVPRPRLPVLDSYVKREEALLPKRMVEEAERPPERRRRVEVELAAVAKDVVGVNGKAKFEKSEPTVAATTCPPVVVFRKEPEAMPEIQRLVVLAVPETEIAVVEAYGKVLALEDVEVIVPPTKRLDEKIPLP